MKSISKTNISFNFYYDARQKSKYNHINIKTTHPVSLTFFSSFLSFDSHVFIFFVFSILSSKLNSISCGICLSFKSRHLELFCILNYYSGILHRYLSRVMVKRFTLQFYRTTFFLSSCEWLLLII